MGATNSTPNYDLSQFVDTDKPTWRGDYNSDMSKLDTALHGLYTNLDPNVTALVASVTSQLRNQLDDLYSRRYSEVDLVEDFGADPTGATPSSTALANAINHINSVGGQVVLNIPPGVYDCTDLVQNNVITVPHVEVRGAGVYRTILRWNTGTLFQVGTSGNKAAYNFRVSHIELQQPTPDTNSICIDMQYGSGTFTDIGIYKIRQLARLGYGAGGTANAVTFRDIIGSTDPNVGAVAFNCVQGSQLTLDNIQIEPDGVGFATDPTMPHPANDVTGLLFGQGGGWDTLIANAVNLSRYNHAFYINLSGAYNVGNMFIVNSVFDLNKTGAITLNSGNSLTGGGIRNIYFDNCWAIAQDGNSVSIDSTGGCPIYHIQFSNVVAHQAGQNNWRFAGLASSTIRVNNCCGIGSNRLASTNTGSQQDDLVILGGGVSVRGGRFGEDGAPYVGYVNQARYGVNIAPNLTSVEVSHVEGEGTTDGIVYNANTVATYTRNCVVKDNRLRTGNLPSYATTTDPVVPASGTPESNMDPFNKTLYVWGGACTNIVHNGVQIGTTGPATLNLRPGDTYQVNYTSAPTFTVVVSP